MFCFLSLSFTKSSATALIIVLTMANLRLIHTVRFFSDCKCNSSQRNKWIVRDSIEMFTQFDCNNITNSRGHHKKQKQITVASKKKSYSVNKPLESLWKGKYVLRKWNLCAQLWLPSFLDLISKEELIWYGNLIYQLAFDQVSAVGALVLSLFKLKVLINSWCVWTASFDPCMIST